MKFVPIPENSPARDLFASFDYQRRRKCALHYPEPRLTDREMQVLALLHAEASYKEIAHALSLSASTINQFVNKGVVRKLREHHPDMRGTTGAILWWERLRGKEKGYTIRVA